MLKNSDHGLKESGFVKGFQPQFNDADDEDGSGDEASQDSQESDTEYAEDNEDDEDDLSSGEINLDEDFSGFLQY